MSHDAPTLLREAAARVPAHPGDLDAVARRARQRTRRTRLGAAASMVVVALLVAGLVQLPADRPPVIDQGTESSSLDVQLCSPQQCPGAAVDVEQAAAAVREVPGVAGVEVVDVETRREHLAEAFDAPPSTIQDDLVAPGLTVRVEDARQLADVAERVAAHVPGATIGRGPAEPHVIGSDPFADAAPTGPRTTVATLDVGGAQVEVRLWPVEGGGRCTSVGDLVECWADRFFEGGPPVATLAWGRPRDGVTCTWAPAGPAVDSVEATFADGTTVDGVVAPAPAGVLAGVQVACVDAATHPSTLATASDGGAATSDGYAPHTEVRPEGVVGFRDIAGRIESGLSHEEAIELAEADTDARLDALAGLLRDLEALEGVEGVEVTGRTEGGHPTVPPGTEAAQVAATVTVAGGDPVCVVALLGDARGQPLGADRPAIWTPEDGCPSLS